MALLAREASSVVLQKHGYAEVRKIGEGSFGKAILVAGEGGAKFVCKMVDVSKASPKELKEALQEGQLLAGLKHPYIVRYRDNFTDGGWLCILMDFCDAGDLSKQIDQARQSRKLLPEEQVLKWLTQVIMALKYLHDRHILHRDLKPSNLFLSKSGALKMGDFGIAKVLSCTMACARTLIGTPYYISPEVCQEKPYSWPSDIWAMGVIVYELCALRVPFEAPTITGLVQRICRGSVPTVPLPYSTPVRQLCSEMMNRTATLRPSPEDILRRPLVQAIVREMLDDAQAQQDAREPQVAPSALAPAWPSAPPPLRGGRGPGKAWPYMQGDLVEYLSSTHQEWLPATVMSVDENGRILIDLKPASWMSLEEQARKIRLRPPATPSEAPAPKVAAPAVPQRSPSAGVLARPQGRGAAPARSPSVGALLERQPPSPVALLQVQGRARPPSGPPSRSPSAPRGPSPRPGQWRDNSPASAAGCPGSRANSPGRISPSRGESPTPLPPPGGRAPSPGAGAVAAGHELAGLRPPCLPRVPDSPLGRRSPAAGAAGGLVIAGV